MSISTPVLVLSCGIRADAIAIRLGRRLIAQSTLVSNAIQFVILGERSKVDEVNREAFVELSADVSRVRIADAAPSDRLKLQSVLREAKDFLWSDVEGRTPVIALLVDPHPFRVIDWEVICDILKSQWRDRSAAALEQCFSALIGPNVPFPDTKNLDRHQVLVATARMAIGLANGIPNSCADNWRPLLVPIDGKNDSDQSVGAGDEILDKLTSSLMGMIALVPHDLQSLRPIENRPAQCRTIGAVMAGVPVPELRRHLESVCFLESTSSNNVAINEQEAEGKGSDWLESTPLAHAAEILVADEAGKPLNQGFARSEKRSDTTEIGAAAKSLTKQWELHRSIAGLLGRRADKIREKTGESLAEAMAKWLDSGLPFAHITKVLAAVRGREVLPVLLGASSIDLRSLKVPHLRELQDLGPWGIRSSTRHSLLHDCVSDAKRRLENGSPSSFENAEGCDETDSSTRGIRGVSDAEDESDAFDSARIRESAAKSSADDQRYLRELVAAGERLFPNDNSLVIDLCGEWRGRFRLVKTPAGIEYKVADVEEVQKCNTDLGLVEADIKQSEQRIRILRAGSTSQGDEHQIGALESGLAESQSKKEQISGNAREGSLAVNRWQQVLESATVVEQSKLRMRQALADELLLAEAVARGQSQQHKTAVAKLIDAESHLRHWQRVTWLLRILLILILAAGTICLGWITLTATSAVLTGIPVGSVVVRPPNAELKLEVGRSTLSLALPPGRWSVGDIANMLNGDGATTRPRLCIDFTNPITIDDDFSDLRFRFSDGVGEVSLPAGDFEAEDFERLLQPNGLRFANGSSANLEGKFISTRIAVERFETLVVVETRGDDEVVTLERPNSGKDAAGLLQWPNGKVGTLYHARQQDGQPWRGGRRLQAVSLRGSLQMADATVGSQSTVRILPATSKVLLHNLGLKVTEAKGSEWWSAPRFRIYVGVWLVLVAAIIAEYFHSLGRKKEQISKLQKRVEAKKLALENWEEQTIGRIDASTDWFIKLSVRSMCLQLVDETLQVIETQIREFDEFSTALVQERKRVTKWVYRPDLRSDRQFVSLLDWTDLDSTYLSGNTGVLIDSRLRAFRDSWPLSRIWTAFSRSRSLDEFHFDIKKNIPSIYEEITSVDVDELLSHRTDLLDKNCEKARQIIRYAAPIAATMAPQDLTPINYFVLHAAVEGRSLILQRLEKHLQGVRSLSLANRAAFSVIGVRLAVDARAIAFLVEAVRELLKQSHTSVPHPLDADRSLCDVMAAPFDVLDDRSFSRAVENLCVLVGSGRLSAANNLVRLGNVSLGSSCCEVFHALAGLSNSAPALEAELKEARGENTDQSYAHWLRFTEGWKSFASYFATSASTTDNSWSFGQRGMSLRVWVERQRLTSSQRLLDGLVDSKLIGENSNATQAIYQVDRFELKFRKGDSNALLHGIEMASRSDLVSASIRTILKTHQLPNDRKGKIRSEGN